MKMYDTPEEYANEILELIPNKQPTDIGEAIAGVAILYGISVTVRMAVGNKKMFWNLSRKEGEPPVLEFTFMQTVELRRRSVAQGLGLAIHEERLGNKTYSHTFSSKVQATPSIVWAQRFANALLAPKPLVKQLRKQGENVESIAKILKISLSTAQQQLER